MGQPFREARDLLLLIGKLLQEGQATGLPLCAPPGRLAPALHVGVSALPLFVTFASYLHGREMGAQSERDVVEHSLDPLRSPIRPAPAKTISAAPVDLDGEFTQKDHVPLGIRPCVGTQIDAVTK